MVCRIRCLKQLQQPNLVHKKGIRNCKGKGTTTGSQKLEIEPKGENSRFGEVKFVLKIGRSLLSVFQLTDNPFINIRFKGTDC